MTLPVPDSRGSFACGTLVALLVAAAPAWGADDPDVGRLAICQDSWLDWQKGDPASVKAFGAHFQSAYSPKENDGSFVPKASETILGLHVLRVYPESVGMGVGFSVVVDAAFDKTRGAVEKTLGKALKKCDVSDGMRTCELEIGAMRTVTLLAGDGKKDVTTLVGCYNYYEK